MDVNQAGAATIGQGTTDYGIVAQELYERCPMAVKKPSTEEGK